MLGLLDKVNDQDTFFYLSLLAQALGGFGAGANATASMAILSSFKTNEREKYIGLVEASFGIGMLFGPLLGAFLYSLGGYPMPFATFATLYLVAFPFIIFSLLRAKKQEPDVSMSQRSANSNQGVDIELSALFKKARFFFGLLSQMCVTMTL